MQRAVVQPENHSVGSNGSQSDSSVQSGEGGFKSPYKLASSFKTTDPIEGFEFSGDRLIVATSKKVSVYDLSGNLLHQFAAGDTIRDIVAEKEMIYVLYPTRIEVFSMTGECLREWEACSEESDYQFYKVHDWTSARSSRRSGVRDMCKIDSGRIYPPDSRNDNTG